jgi:F-box protein 11
LSIPTRIGKFEIIKCLGKGAMGEVFLGRDPALGREVAIKTILGSSAFGEEAHARFEREAKATAVLNHPNIVTVFEFGQDEGLHYLVMEYLEGEDLEVMIQKRSLPKASLLEVLVQVCEGLAFAHERGIIHRDVKPANVFVTQRAKKIQAKLMDFGVALLNQSNLTQQGVWMGTVNYMAPEYLDSGKATPSSDLFAVGVMLYEVLSGGRKPFSGDTTTMVLNAILRQAPQPLEPGEIRDVSPALLRVAQKALHKVPGNRYPTAEALGAAIREAMRESPPRVEVSAPEVPRLETPTQELTRLLPSENKVPSRKILIVGKGGKANCLSIRVALRLAERGTQIVVQPGIYKESLVVDKDVEILGEGDPSEIILESPKGPCLLVKTEGATIQGLTLRKAATEGDENPLVHVQSGKHSIRQCAFHSESGAGLILEGQGTLGTLDQCSFTGGSRLGVKVGPGASLSAAHCRWEGKSRQALLVDSNASATLSHPVFLKGEGLAIAVRSQGQLQVEDGFIEDCLAGGIEADAEARINLIRTRITNSIYAGVLVMEKGQAILEGCEITGHGAAGVHAVEGASLELRQCRLHDNPGFGLSVMDRALARLDACEIHQNGRAGLLIHGGGTAQLKTCKVFDGQSLGVVCAPKGRGVLEACEIYGNVQSGAKVEPGGSLLLVQCVLRDGQDTGLLLFEDAEATLEQCVVHRNARGGILLTKDASDPILRKGNRIEDDLWRTNAKGERVKVVPVKR